MDLSCINHPAIQALFDSRCTNCMMVRTGHILIKFESKDVIVDQNGQPVPMLIIQPVAGVSRNLGCIKASCSPHLTFYTGRNWNILDFKNEIGDPQSYNNNDTIINNGIYVAHVERAVSRFLL